MRISKKTHRQGFSLFEVLVALVLLTIGMLGIAHMLLVAHKSNSSNYIRQQAIQAAYDIIDRMHANRQAAVSGHYIANNLVGGGTPTPPSTPSTNCDTSVCTSVEMAAYDTWHWLSKNVTQLPNGCGSITTAASGISTLVTVTVQWDDTASQQMLGGINSGLNQFTIQSEL